MGMLRQLTLGWGTRQGGVSRIRSTAEHARFLAFSVVKKSLKQNALSNRQRSDQCYAPCIPALNLKSKPDDQD